MARKTTDDATDAQEPPLNEARFDAAIEAAADAVQAEIEAMLEEMDATVTDDKDGHHLILGALSDSTHYPHLQSYVAETLKNRIVDDDTDDTTPDVSGSADERTDIVVELNGVEGLPDDAYLEDIVADLEYTLANIVVEHHADSVDRSYADVREVGE